MQNYRGQKFRGRYRGNCRNDDFGRGKSRSRERQYSNNFRRNDQSSGSRSRSHSRASTNRDRTRCYKCREYAHFAKDCPNPETEIESEQMQQMFNLDKDQTALKVLMTDIFDNIIRTSSDDAKDLLNL